MISLELITIVDLHIDILSRLDENQSRSIASSLPDLIGWMIVSMSIIGHLVGDRVGAWRRRLAWKILTFRSQYSRTASTH